jgi:hypothetical protein
MDRGQELNFGRQPEGTSGRKKESWGKRNKRNQKHKRSNVTEAYRLLH